MGCPRILGHPPLYLCNQVCEDRLVLSKQPITKSLTLKSISIMEGLYFLFVVAVSVGSLVNSILTNEGHGCQND